ncbi:Uncharacterised protein, partial [Mycoplasma putrefaciens]
MQAFPEIYKALKAINKNKTTDNKIKAIYGLEANVLNRDLW